MTTSTEDAERPAPVLLVLSGRPGTGKTTIAREVSRRAGACYLRVDAAETALATTGAEVGVGGYAVVHELAVSNLLLGSTVVVDAVNPVPEARASWRDAWDEARDGRRLLVDSSDTAAAVAMVLDAVRGPAR